jgi:nicotinate phosphoribosyltransferase
MSSQLEQQQPTNSLVTAMLTDLYQITMTYAHWKIGKHDDPATFELFFRKNPFKGQFTIFCGLDECLKHIASFKFSQQDIEYLKSTPALAHCEDGYFEYLRNLDTSQLTVKALQEGTIVFPRIPLLIIEAPLGLGQLLETTLLNLVNYPSLIATNAARMVLRANGATCIEFGLRRAQGPDGACSASKYSFIGGFSATSNVQAGRIFGIPIAGTHAHAYVQAFASLEEVEGLELLNQATGKAEKFLDAVLSYRENKSTNDGELAAFVAYACAFPDNCLCLIDTYDTLASGLLNFCYVAMALDDFGYTPKGVRLDSGDLATLSLACQKRFQELSEVRKEAFGNLSIVASNDINEQVLVKLNSSPHGMTAYGIGTNLVTCQAQPALGCVYKLVTWKGKPRIKISQDLPKVTIPGGKRVYRLVGRSGQPIADYMTRENEPAPQPGQRVVCRNPFEPQQRMAVTPTAVQPLHNIVFETGLCTIPVASLSESKAFVSRQLTQLPVEITRYETPRPYCVMVSADLFRYLHELWEQEAAMEERS